MCNAPRAMRRGYALAASVGVPAHRQAAFFSLPSFTGATLRGVLPTTCPQGLSSSLQTPLCLCLALLSPLGRLHPRRHAGDSLKREKPRKGPSGSHLASATWFLTWNSEQTAFLPEPQFPLLGNGSHDTCQVQGATEEEQLAEGASCLHPPLRPGLSHFPPTSGSQLL